MPVCNIPNCTKSDGTDEYDKMNEIRDISSILSIFLCNY